jgi:hypothetical protein
MIDCLWWRLAFKYYNNNWFNFISKLPSLINLMIKMENTSALKALNHSDVYNLKKEIPKDHK